MAIPFWDWEDGGWRSGPPQAWTMRIRTEKASLAVGKSVMSLARCSIVEMTASKAGWLAWNFINVGT